MRAFGAASHSSRGCPNTLARECCRLRLFALDVAGGGPTERADYPPFDGDGAPTGCRYTVPAIGRNGINRVALPRRLCGVWGRVRYRSIIWNDTTS